MATKSFITYNPTSGSNNGQLSVTASKNDTTSARATNLSVAGGGYN